MAVASSRLPGFVPFRCRIVGKRCKKTSFFCTILKNLNKRGKIRPFFTPFCSLFGYGIFLLSGGAVRRNSLRCAPFGPPTVSCVLAPARTCLRQAPPTSRGRGLATSAVLYHLTDDMSIYTIFLGNAVKCFIFAFAYVFTHPR